MAGGRGDGRGKLEKVFKFSKKDVEIADTWKGRTNTPEELLSLTEVQREKGGLYAAMWRGEVSPQAAEQFKRQLVAIKDVIVAIGDERRKDRELELRVVAAEETEKRLEAIEEMLRQAGGA